MGWAWIVSRSWTLGRRLLWSGARYYPPIVHNSYGEAGLIRPAWMVYKNAYSYQMGLIQTGLVCIRHNSIPKKGLFMATTLTYMPNRARPDIPLNPHSGGRTSGKR